jgi:hypothetical protein
VHHHAHAGTGPEAGRLELEWVRGVDPVVVEVRLLGRGQLAEVRPERGLRGAPPGRGKLGDAYGEKERQPDKQDEDVYQDQTTLGARSWNVKQRMSNIEYRMTNVEVNVVTSSSILTIRNSPFGVRYSTFDIRAGHALIS